MDNKNLLVTLRAGAAAEANKSPLPGPAAQAFGLTQHIKVDDYQVRPFVDYDMIVMSELGLGTFDSNKTEKAACLCFLLTTPVMEVRQILRKPSGIDDFSEAALAKFFPDSLPITQKMDLLNKVGGAIAEQHKRYVEMQQTYASKAEGKAEEHFFPASQVDQKTAMVGS